MIVLYESLSMGQGKPIYKKEHTIKSPMFLKRGSVFAPEGMPHEREWSNVPARHREKSASLSKSRSHEFQTPK